MQYTKSLSEGVFLKRYKRFFTDIDYQGQTLVAHTPNTGSMKGVAVTGQPCRFSESDNPERKLKFTLEMIQAPTGAWVGVNTAIPNTIVKEALESAVNGQGFSFWQGYEEVKPEFKISAETRFDFALFKNSRQQVKYIEVKNVTLAEEGIAKFPDAVTERGQKHLRELTRLVGEGAQAEIVFVVQRNDCHAFAPAADIDPEYALLLKRALDAGVVIRPLVAELTNEKIVLSEKQLPLQWGKS